MKEKQLNDDFSKQPDEDLAVFFYPFCKKRLYDTMSQSLEMDMGIEISKEQEDFFEGRTRLGNRAMSKELMNLGSRIRERRQQIHLSQEILAERIGISSNTISRIEGGQTAMSVEIFLKLVHVLEVDANVLLGKTKEESKGEGGQLQGIFHRIRQLEYKKQQIVMQTMEVLMDGLEH